MFLKLFTNLILLKIIVYQANTQFGIWNAELLYKPLPPSDEEGGFLRSKKTEGETENTVNKHFLSLSHEFPVPAPSSEGANGISIQLSDKPQFIF